eukprot:SAG31_NODE_10_length_40133_cov_27.863041_17_plen_535_part_00
MRLARTPAGRGHPTVVLVSSAALQAVRIARIAQQQPPPPLRRAVLPDPRGCGAGQASIVFSAAPPARLRIWVALTRRVGSCPHMAASADAQQPAATAQPAQKLTRREQKALAAAEKKRRQEEQAKEEATAVAKKAKRQLKRQREKERKKGAASLDSQDVGAAGNDEVAEADCTVPATGRPTDGESSKVQPSDATRERTLRPEFAAAAPLGLNSQGAPIRKTRKKTRSKQKNLRKDTRPPALRPGGSAHVADRNASGQRNTAAATAQPTTTPSTDTTTAPAAGLMPKTRFESGAGDMDRRHTAAGTHMGTSKSGSDVPSVKASLIAAYLAETFESEKLKPAESKSAPLAKNMTETGRSSAPSAAESRRSADQQNRIAESGSQNRKKTKSAKEASMAGQKKAGKLSEEQAQAMEAAVAAKVAAAGTLTPKQRKKLMARLRLEHRGFGKHTTGDGNESSDEDIEGDRKRAAARKARAQARRLSATHKQRTQREEKGGDDNRDGARSHILDDTESGLASREGHGNQQAKKKSKKSQKG